MKRERVELRRRRSDVILRSVGEPEQRFDDGRSLGKLYLAFSLLLHLEFSPTHWSIYDKATHLHVDRQSTSEIDASRVKHILVDWDELAIATDDGEVCESAALKQPRTKG